MRGTEPERDARPERRRLRVAEWQPVHVARRERQRRAEWQRRCVTERERIGRPERELDRPEGQGDRAIRSSSKRGPAACRTVRMCSPS